MHVGAVVMFEGPPPPREDLIAHIESRLRLVPRYRQRLAFPRFEMGRPFWVDDPSFNLDYHVRHTALPRPGSEEQLRQLVGRIFSQRLDRSKPLWEIWLVQGLEDNRFALISKTHHALVDGVSGVDIATVLFDLQPVPAELEADDGWTPEPVPSDVELVAEGVKGLVKTPFSLAGRALDALQNPGRSVAQARHAAEGVGEVVWAGLNPAPDVPLNVEIGPHRRVLWVPTSLADFKAIKNGLGGTVNDAVLTVVAGALGRWLRTRGVRTEGLELRALVPVSIRAEDEKGIARQPDRGDARAAAGIRRRAGRAAAARARGDGEPEAVEAGARRRGDLRAAGLRPAHAARPGVEAQLLHQALQPDRDERAGTAVPALPAGARDG